MTVPDFSALFQQLDYCQSRDVHALRTRLHGLKKRAAKGLPTDKSLAEISAQIAASQQAVAARHALVPTIQYPDDLPVVLRREEILAALAKNQVLILCGETGSGKTTQLPKLALEAGRGVRGLIGHTQPRRIAARSVAARIAEELDTPLGEKVGFQVRFSTQTSDATLIKVMTDGVLLAEIHSDPLLSRYDTLIIDEAHERSLNIDFLLGFLKRLLPKRPELKLIVTSATLDVERFSAHFDGAEIMSVEGRTYPVEMRYRPVQGDDDDRDRDLPRALLDAVDELALEGAGDILVFFDGERAIREAEEALRKHPVPKHLGATEILPLYARLSAADQARVFQKHNARRIVLATNVAETSLTVPGIRYVIDTGLARVSRFSARAGVQRLQVEPISQAAARQRAGRCGRLGAGICIRLYAEDDFNQRPAHTDPEILRTNLAAVILRMESLRLGHVDDFPFLDRPDGQQIKAAYDLLFELQAVDEARVLTSLGAQLARLPVDPRLGRMLLAGEKDGCLAEMLVIVSGLSVQDPRDRPPERQQAADQAHAAWKNASSDFLSLLALWRWYEEQAHHLSQAKLRTLCEKNFLSYVRMREWRALHQELRGVFHEDGVHENETAVSEDVVHRAVMTGLLGHLALREEEKRKTNPAQAQSKGKGRPEPQSYLGVKGRKLAIHPGSALVKLPPKWLMSAQWLETTRLWGATNAAINPRWIEPLARHLLTREISEPHYQTDSGRVAAFETLSLYGLPVVVRRAVNYAAIDPAGSRRIFVREGMLAVLEADVAADDERARHPWENSGFIQHNAALIAEIHALEAKARRPDILVDDAVLCAFFEQHVPPEVVDGVTLAAALRREQTLDARLRLTREVLMRHEAEAVTGGRLPDRLRLGEVEVALRYHFAPGAEDDGVTASLPLAELNRLNVQAAEWLVPGLLQDKIEALIRALPKNMRRHLVPAPDVARALVERVTEGLQDWPPAGSLPERLSQEARRMLGVDIAPEDWPLSEIEPHLRLRVELVDDHGELRGSGRDLAAMQQALGGAAKRAFVQRFETRKGLVEWSFGALAEVMVVDAPATPLSPSSSPARGEGRKTKDATSTTVYPALIDAGESVTLQPMDTAEAAAQATANGLTRLFVLAAHAEVKALKREVARDNALCLLYSALPALKGAVKPCADLQDEVVWRVARAVFLDAAEPAAWPREPEAFAARVALCRPRLYAEGLEALRRLRALLQAVQEFQNALQQVSSAHEVAVKDMQAQFAALFARDFIRATPPALWQRLPVYVQTASKRLERLKQNPERERQARAQLEPVLARAAKLKSVPDEWVMMLEEWRVQLFAQELKTAMPVSLSRVNALLEGLGG
ncbi:MAG: ATP-dependent RNA helicase HrpA [Halothiobacillaceae bacterium]|nr:ATP-dependent RNA helicase HrpA [Halothiobacillaceae bacterium]